MFLVVEFLATLRLVFVDDSEEREQQPKKTSPTKSGTVRFPVRSNGYQSDFQQ